MNSRSVARLKNEIISSSEVEPKGSVSKDTSEGGIFPESSISLMTLWLYFPSCQVVGDGGSWENLSGFSVIINL